MSCARYAQDLAELAVGGPAPAEALAHLDVCAACRAELTRLRGVQARIEAEMRDLLLEEPSPAFSARVRRCLDERQQHRQGLAWLLSAAAAMAIALLSLRLLLLPETIPPTAAPQRVVVESPAASVLQRATADAIRPRVRRFEPPPSATEVLVPAEQQELLLRLVRAMDEQPPPLASWSPARSAPVDVGSIDVARIQVAPLTLESSELKLLQMESEEGAS